MNQRVVVIDYGMGNLHSVAKALEQVAPDAQILVSSDVETIRQADRIILPGVGAIRDCLAELRGRGLEAITREVFATKPFLGICVGLQALMDRSEENSGTDCLGLLPGQVRHFGVQYDQDGRRLKVPHMGWSRVQQLVKHPLWQGINDNERFYFVHSYALTETPAELVIGRSCYGLEFASVIARNNVVAVQFHPEKSHSAGLALLKNFVGWTGQA